MFPLIPAIILLLLQGSSGLERPQAGRMPQGWNLRREVSTRDARAQAALAQFLAIAACDQLDASQAQESAPKELRPAHPRVEREEPRAPAPKDGFQTCRRSRDGPDSIG